MIPAPDQQPSRSPLQPMLKRDLLALHELLFGLHFFVKMNYVKEDDPPSDEEITRIEEYIERAIRHAP